MQKIAKSEATLLQTAAVAFTSSRGRALDDIEQACLGRLHTALPVTYKHPIEDRARTPQELEIVQAQLRLSPDQEINVTGNLPQQFESQLRRWASQLLDMAERVGRIKPTEFKLAPLAYIVTDAETGEVIASSCICSVARQAGLEHLEKTGHLFNLSSGPIEEFPDVLQEFRHLCNQVEPEDVYDDGVELTPLV